MTKKCMPKSALVISTELRQSSMIVVTMIMIMDSDDDDDDDG